MNVTTYGIDLAKNVFQIHGADAKGKALVRRRLSRRKLLAYFANCPHSLIGLEACGSSNYWARRLRTLGHEVRRISPQYVKPYVKTNKNDGNDAEAICEAVTRPEMRFVSIKSVEQQDMQSLHRVRDRTAVVNQTRGLLREYGVFIPAGIGAFRREIATVLEDAENELTALTRELVADQYARLIELDQHIVAYKERIETIFRENESCQRMVEVEGVGPLAVTALMAAVGDAREFKNGRHLAAWVGLLPRQHSSGQRTRLLGISKRGNTYLRTLLIHGARSVVSRCETKTDARSRWLQGLKARRGINCASVALANKNARILWALLAHGDTYRKAA